MFLFLFTFALRPTEWSRSNNRKKATLFSIFKKNMMHKLFARLVMKIKPRERKTDKSSKEEKRAQEPPTAPSRNKSIWAQSVGENGKAHRGYFNGQIDVRMSRVRMIGASCAVYPALFSHVLLK